MRQILILFAFLATVFTANAQISAGTVQVANYGDHYRIVHSGPVFNNAYPKPDSASLRITVICPKNMTYEVNDVPLGTVLKYRMGGMHYIAVSVIWWKNGVKKSQTSIPTVCGFYLNPLECFQKIS